MPGVNSGASLNQAILGSSSDFEIRPISVADALPLRQKLLRPHQTLENLVHPDDDAPDSLHVGAFLDGQLVGVASVSRSSPPGEVDQNVWQLRSIATVPEMRRAGCGAALACACITHVAAHGGTALWCNGRTSALAFYRALGFQTRGEEFQVPYTGPHYVMWRRVYPHER